MWSNENIKVKYILVNEKNKISSVEWQIWVVVGVILVKAFGK